MGFKKYLYISLIFMGAPLRAESLKQIFNPAFGGGDFYTRLDNTTLIAGAGISISCVDGVCTITNTGGGGGASFILLEDSSVVLAENGAKLLTE